MVKEAAELLCMHFLHHCSSNFISRRIQYDTFHTYNISTISQMYSSGGCREAQWLIELTTAYMFDKYQGCKLFLAMACEFPKSHNPCFFNQDRTCSLHRIWSLGKGMMNLTRLTCETIFLLFQLDLLVYQFYFMYAGILLSDHHFHLRTKNIIQNTFVAESLASSWYFISL